MKKLLLLSTILVSFFTSEAQTTTSQNKKIKKPKIDKEALMQARLDSLESARQLRIDSMVTAQFRVDSVRKFNDSIAEVKSQQERLAWNENKAKETDSINKEHVKMLSKEHAQSLSIQSQRETLGKAAKLNDYQQQQVVFINQLYFGKAQKIKQDPALAEDKKRAELTKLNDERVNRLKTVIGKSKEKKLEKARKNQKNTIDTDTQWISEVDGVAKS
ncbi:MAG: hypothetical protein QM737_21270 [Ferruginibacter sp.]